MRTVYHTVSYPEYAGHKFSREQLIKDLLSYERPFYGALTVLFDKNKKIELDKRHHVNPIVENPSIDLSKKCIEGYMSSHELSSVVHASKFHKLHIYHNGETSLEFLISGERNFDGYGGVYTATLKKPEQVTKQVKIWSSIANKLGFQSFPPKTLKLKDDCNAVKLCTKFMKLEKNEITPYITDKLLPALDEPKSKLSISSMTSYLFIDSKTINLSLPDDISISKLKNELDFAIDMMGEPLKEPNIRYGVEVETSWDEVKEWCNAHKSKIGLASVLSSPLLISTGVSYGFSGNSSGAVVGAFVGGVVDVIGISCFYGKRLWEKRKSKKEKEKEEARNKFLEFARSQPHMKDPYGSCILISTDNCVLKAAKKEQK